MNIPIDFAMISDLFMKAVGFFLSILSTNPALALGVAGVAILLVILIMRKIEESAWALTSFVIIICLIIFLVFAMISLGFNISKFMGFLPNSLSINDWLKGISTGLNKP